MDDIKKRLYDELVRLEVLPNDCIKGYAPADLKAGESYYCDEGAIRSTSILSMLCWFGYKYLVEKKVLILPFPDGAYFPYKTKSESGTRIFNTSNLDEIILYSLQCIDRKICQDCAGRGIEKGIDSYKNPVTCDVCSGMGLVSMDY